MVRLANPGGGFGQAQIYDGSDRDWEGAVERETTPWLSFSHERVIPVLSVASTANRLVIVHGDERGPSIHGMAGLLRDTSERTHWSVEQIAGVAEAIAMMAWRQHGFVHRRANHEQIVVGVDGTARLRAPVAFVAWGKPGTYTGRDNSMGKSIRYLSPEQIRGEPPTAASDVHTLGGTLYKALTGRAPFGEGGTELDTMNAIHTGVTPPTPTDVPPALAALVMRALARDAAARPANPATFAAELRRCMPEPLSRELLAKVAMLRPDTRPAPSASELIVGNRCAKQWDELTQTPTQGVRHCGHCQHDVVQVRSLAALVPLLGQRCVSFKDGGEN
jgi:serine/threonine protein kinase